MQPLSSFRDSLALFSCILYFSDTVQYATRSWRQTCKLGTLGNLGIDAKYSPLIGQILWNNVHKLCGTFSLSHLGATSPGNHDWGWWSRYWWRPCWHHQCELQCPQYPTWRRLYRPTILHWHIWSVQDGVKLPGNQQHNCTHTFRHRLARHPRFCHWCSHRASGCRIRSMRLLLLHIYGPVALSFSSHPRLSDWILFYPADILCTHICHVVTITFETFLVGHYFIPKTHPTGITDLVVAFP